MTHSVTQIGTDGIPPCAPTWTLGHGTTLNLPPAMETVAPVGVSSGRLTAMPSMATNCTAIGWWVWSLISCRAQERLPVPVAIRQISPSGLVIGIVGYW